MFILRKNYKKEVSKLNEEIDTLVKNINVLEQSEIDHREQKKMLVNTSRRVNDRNISLLKKVEDKEKEIAKLNETIVKLCEKYDTEICQKEYKIENLENDISNLKKYANQNDKKIEKFKINSILRLQSEANRAKKVRIKNKRQKLHNEELISTLEKIF